MISELCSLNNELNKLNLKTVLLKDSINRYILMRERCIRRNKINERQIQSLVNLKEQYEYLKDTLLEENYRFSINTGKRSILLSHRVREFQKKKEQRKLKLESLPASLQLQEITDINEKLYFEYLNWHEKLEKLRKEYWDIARTVQNEFVNKVVRFSEEYSQLRHNSKNNISPVYYRILF